MASKRLVAPFYYTNRVQPQESLPPNTTLGGYIHKLVWKWSGYHKYGLYHDDVLYNYPDVLEAVRRLPGEVQDERNYRLLRAIQSHIRREFLPENQWTTYENDCTIGRYMTPYLDDVRKEIAEQDEWNAEH